MRNEVIDTHYQNVVNVYNSDSLFFLKSSYEEWVINSLKFFLRLNYIPYQYV